MRRFFHMALCALVISGCIIKPDEQGGEGGGEHDGGPLTGVGGQDGGIVLPLICSPDSDRTCWCDQGYESVQACADDGSAWLTCNCSDECADDADCHGTMCEPATCVDGQCNHSKLGLGTFVTQEPFGDCAMKVCIPPNPDATELYALPVLDVSDVPDDDNVCTIDLCIDGWPTHVPAPIGTECTGGTCNGAGSCFVP